MAENIVTKSRKRKLNDDDSESSEDGDLTCNSVIDISSDSESEVSAKDDTIELDSSDSETEHNTSDTVPLNETDSGVSFVSNSVPSSGDWINEDDSSDSAIELTTD